MAEPQEVIFDPSQIKPLATHNEPPEGKGLREQIFNWMKEPFDLNKLNEMLTPLAHPQEARDFAGLLLPDSAAGISAASKAVRSGAGKAVEAVGKGATAVGENVKSPLVSLFGLTQVANHPVLGSSMILGGPVMRGAGAGLQKVGRMLAPAVEGGPRLATLGLSPEEAAVQRALQMLKEQRATAAGPVTEAAQAAEAAPKTAGPVDITKKPPVDYTKYSRPASQPIEDFVPPKGTMGENGKIIPPTVEEHLAALKAYQARKYPGRATAPKPPEPPLYGSPESIAAINAQEAARAAQGGSAAPAGESLGDLGRAISSDVPNPAAAPAAPPVTSSEAVVEAAQRAHRVPRGGAPGAVSKKGTRTAASAVAEKTTKPPQARAAVEGQGAETTPIPGSQEARTTEQTLGSAGSGQLRSGAGLPGSATPTEMLPSHARTTVGSVLDDTIRGAAEGNDITVPRQTYTAQELNALRDLRAGKVVDPDVARAALQKIREALGSAGMKKQGFKPGMIAQTTGGEIPLAKLAQIRDAVKNITTPEAAQAYMKAAPPNIRLTVETILKKRGLL